MKKGAAFEITLFSKTGGPLTKRISLAPDGKLVSDGSACVMSRGTAERATIANVDEFATLIGTMRSVQAIALGTLRAGLPDKVAVVSQKQLNGAAWANVIARTGANIEYQGPALVLFDYDTKVCRRPSRPKSSASAASGRHYWPCCRPWVASPA